MILNLKAIYSLKVFEPMALDVEGRTIALEFAEFIIVTVYTPNSQKLDSL